MSERDIGAEILDGLKEIQAHKQGRLKLRTTRLSEPSMPQTIRAKLALTQSEPGEAQARPVRAIPNPGSVP